MNQISKYFIENFCIYIHYNNWSRVFPFFFFCRHHFFLLLFLRAFLEKSYWSQFPGGVLETVSESICSRNILVVKFFITALASLFLRLCLVICILLVHLNRPHVFKNLSILCFSTCWNSPKFSLIILWQKSVKYPMVNLHFY